MLKINGNDLTGLIDVLDIEVRECIETVVQDASNTWVVKKALGQVIIQARCVEDEEGTSLEKIVELKNLLASGVLQVNDRYYNSKLIVGVNKEIDPSNFNILFNIEDNGEIGLYPMKPKNITTKVIGKLVTFNFDKGVDAASTKIEFNGEVFEALENSLVLVCPEEEKNYSATLYSVSSNGTIGEKVEVKFTSDKVYSEALTPINIEIKDVIGRKIILGFKKDENIELVQAIVNEEVFQTFNENEIVILAKDFNTLYEITLVGVTSDGVLSEPSLPIQVVSGSEIVPTSPIINELIVNERVLTVKFSKGLNADYTEFKIDNQTLFVLGESIEIQLSSYDKEYILEATSISATDSRSEKVEEFIIVPKKPIYPNAPYNIVVNEVNGKVVTLSFAKGINCATTEIMVGGSIYSTDGEIIELMLPLFETEYSLMIRGVSESYHKTEWIEAIVVRTGAEDVTPEVPTDISVLVSGRMATVSFNKGVNADLTQLVLVNDIYSTSENSINIALDLFNTTYAIKLRSISQGKVLGEFTEEITFTTDVEDVNARLINNADEHYSVIDNVNVTSNGASYNNLAEVEPTELVENNINRYSVGGSLVNGKLN